MNLANNKVLIVEDEVIIAESIKLYLFQLGYENIKMAHDFTTAVSLIETWQPLIVLLDIQLENDDDGIRLGKIVNELRIPFMYITANIDNNTTQRILETKPSGFISKPIKPNEFKINLHMLNLQSELSQTIKVTLSNGSDKLHFYENQLNYLMSDANYIEVHLDDARHIIRNTLDGCLQELNSNKFVRIHRSYVVAIDRVIRLNPSSAELKDVVLPVSRSHHSSLKQALKTRFN